MVLIVSQHTSKKCCFNHFKGNEMVAFTILMVDLTNKLSINELSQSYLNAG